MSHTKGRAVLELAMAYIEQQTKATEVNVMLTKKWHDFAFNKTDEQKSRR